MKLLAFSVSDRVLGHFNPPLFARTEAQVVREFQQTYRMRKELELPAYLHTAFENPSDNALYRIGDFDDTTGRFEPVNSMPVHVFSFDAIVGVRKDYVSAPPPFESKNPVPDLPITPGSIADEFHEDQ